MVARLLLCGIVAFGVGVQARADLAGTVVGVADGDTLTVLTNDGTLHKVRLAGIDAPEKAQPFGQRSKLALSNCAFGRAVRVEGANELDISAMITYTTGDKWLANGGKIAFLVTQTLFQNPSSSGFRNFRVDANTNLSPALVEEPPASRS